MKRLIYLPIVFLSVLWGYPLQAQSRYALVIGNGKYQYGRTLRNSSNDARLLRDKLNDCGFKVIEKEDLGKDDFIKAVNDFFSKIQNARAEALLFYSGHGIQSAGENYLIPVDADLNSEEDIKQKCVGLQYLLGKMKDAATRVNIIILDACRNDPFTKGWDKGEGEKGLSAIIRTPPQSFIAFATAPSEVASEGKGTNSPYSAAIAKFMCEPGWNIFQVFQQVSIEVRKQNPRQFPWNNYNLDNDFVFMNGKGFSGGPRPMEFLITEDCILFINGQKKGSFPGGAQFQIPNQESGVYKIRVVNQHDSMQFVDTVYNYNPSSNPGDNLMYIPLNNIVFDPNLKPMLDSLSRDMIRIEGGDFFMGSKAGKTDETPEHSVHLNAFSIGRVEVTQRQWRLIMKDNPSFHGDCDNCPVENVSWDDAMKFVSALNQASGDHYRLPTEAEWEFAARGGNLSNNNKFSGNSSMKKAGWYFDNATGSTHPVGRRPVNELGLADMSGNVAEWCADWYAFNYYNNSRRDNPTGPSGGTDKVARGGSWNDYEDLCKTSARDKHGADHKDKTIGFRLARD